MTGFDHSLIYEVQKFITGANVHDVKTWIFCYETSLPNSRHHERYEKLLREFVATKRLHIAARRQKSLPLNLEKICDI
jgi:hypothetical protein